MKVDLVCSMPISWGVSSKGYSRGYYRRQLDDILHGLEQDRILDSFGECRFLKFISNQWDSGKKRGL